VTNIIAQASIKQCKIELLYVLAVPVATQPTEIEVLSNPSHFFTATFLSASINSKSMFLEWF